MLKICGVQIELSENIESNFEKHLSYMKDIDADLIVFPECSLTGYNLDKIMNIDYFLLEDLNQRLIEISKEYGKNIIFGTVKQEGSKLFNCAYIGGQNFNKFIVYKKINLTEEEKDIFSKGENLIDFDINGVKLSVIICRDQSNQEIFFKLKEKKVNTLLILSAHYYNPKDMLWKRYKNIAIPITRAMDFKLNIVKVNSVGAFGLKTSHGNSLFVNREGKLLRILNEYEEDIFFVNLSN